MVSKVSKSLYQLLDVTHTHDEEVKKEMIEEMMTHIQQEGKKMLPREIEVNIPPKTFFISNDMIYLIVGGTKGWISVYSLISGQILKKIDETTNPIVSICQVSDKLVASDAKGKLLIFDYPGIIFKKSLMIDGVSPMLNFLFENTVMITHSKVSLLNLKTEEISDIEIPEPPSCSDIFGNTIAIASLSGTVTLFNATMLSIDRSVQLTKGIKMIRLSESYISTAHEDFSVTVWDSNFQEILSIDSHTNRISGLAFIENSLITISKDMDAVVWRLKRRQPREHLRLYNSPATHIMVVDRMIYISHKNNMVLEWALPKSLNDCRYSLGEAMIRDMEFFENHEFLVTIDESGKLTIWNYHTHQVVKVIDFESKINRMSISKCQSFAIVSSEDPALYKLDLEDYSIQKLNDRSITSCIKFHSNEKIMVTGDSQNNLIVWDVPEMVEKMVLKGHSKPITSACLLESEVLTGSKDCTIRKWDLKSGQALVKFIGHTAPISNIRLHANKEVIISSSLDSSLIFWDKETGHRLSDLVLDLPILNMISLSNDRFLITVDQEKVSFVDLKVQVVFSSLRFNQDLQNIAISKNQEYVAIASGGTLHIKTNPVMDSQFWIYGEHSEIKYQFLKFLVSILKDKENTDPYQEEFSNLIVTPYMINVVHIFAFMNRPDLIRLALKGGGSLFTSKNEESALGIALQHAYVESINVIVKYMAKVSEKIPRSLSPLEHSLYYLNYINMEYLPVLYSSLLVHVDLPYIPKFCTQETTLPVYKANPHMKIEPKDFINPGQNRKEVNISFYVSAVPISVNTGSTKSLRLLNSLKNAPQSSIFMSDFVESFLDFKWDQVRLLIYLITFFEGFHGLLLTVYCIGFLNYPYYLALPTTTGFILAIYETVHAFCGGWLHLKDIWNYIDALHLITLGLYCLTEWKEWLEDYRASFLVISLTCCYLKGIMHFRIFPSVRYIINLLIEVMKDMKGFLILLMYLTVTFGIINLILPSYDPETSLNPVLAVYLLNLGEYSYDHFVYLDWFFFILATFINGIVMLNLVIAIMSNTFERVQSENTIASRKELLNMIIDIELLYFWNRSHNDRSYLQVCRETPMEFDENDPMVKISKNISNLKKNVQSLDQKQDLILEQLNQLMTKIDALPSN